MTRWSCTHHHQHHHHHHHHHHYQQQHIETISSQFYYKFTYIYEWDDLVIVIILFDYSYSHSRIRSGFSSEFCGQMKHGWQKSAKFQWYNCWPLKMPASYHSKWPNVMSSWSLAPGSNSDDTVYMSQLLPSGTHFWYNFNTFLLQPTHTTDLNKVT